MSFEGRNALSNKSFNMLIAGVIGSGTSYTESKIIEKLKSDPDVQMVFIDPKKVELHQYKSLPNCLWYADDEQGIREIVRKYGEYEGFTVLEAGNGEEALRVCREENPAA